MKYLSLIVFLFPLMLTAQKNIDVNFYHEKVGNDMFIFADNHTFAPVSAEYSYTAENMESSLPDKAQILIPPQGKKFAVSVVKVKNPKIKSSFSYDIAFVLGDVNVRDHDDNYVYSLPFKTQKTYLIYQGYNGKFSHQHAYSLDFSLKENDAVYAARDGKVVEIETENSTHCPNLECAKFNNKIVILHADGTLGEYVHLRKNGNAVQPGDDITKNQLLAYSGNTGFSKGPHLHFSVYINNIDGTRRYIKTRFKTSKSPAAFLEEGKSYTKDY